MTLMVSSNAGFTQAVVPILSGFEYGLNGRSSARVLYGLQGVSGPLANPAVGMCVYVRRTDVPGLNVAVVRDSMFFVRAVHWHSTTNAIELECETSTLLASDLVDAMERPPRFDTVAEADAWLDARAGQQT